MDVAVHVPCEDEFEYRGITWNRYTSRELIQRSETFQFRPEDVLLATFPRSGTTLTQEIIWQIVHHDEVQRDAKYPDHENRFPFLEHDSKFMISPDLANPVDVLEQQSGGRLIKTHLPYFILRDQVEKVNPKLVIVIRNPKDNAVSMFHFHRAVRQFGWDGSWPQFLSLYGSGRTFSGDFFTNNLEWWALRDRPNVLILRYEDLLHQPHHQIRIIADFLGYNPSPEQVDMIAHNTSFQIMRKNEYVNVMLSEGAPFLRKGQVGGWRDMFTVAQNEAMDRHISAKLEGSGLTFTYE